MGSSVFTMLAVAAGAAVGDDFVDAAVVDAVVAAVVLAEDGVGLDSSVFTILAVTVDCVVYASDAAVEAGGGAFGAARVLAKSARLLSIASFFIAPPSATI